jgi:hypothetical protein
MVYVTSITGTATLSNGHVVEFEASAEGSSRWGADTPDLGAAVDVTDDLARLIEEHTYEPEEDEVHDDAD